VPLTPARISGGQPSSSNACRQHFPSNPIQSYPQSHHSSNHLRQRNTSFSLPLQQLTANLSLRKHPHPHTSNTQRQWLRLLCPTARPPLPTTTSHASPLPAEHSLLSPTTSSSTPRQDVSSSRFPSLQKVYSTPRIPLTIATAECRPRPSRACLTSTSSASASSLPSPVSFTPSAASSSARCKLQPFQPAKHPH
jgi:hypothetical protein